MARCAEQVVAHLGDELDPRFQRADHLDPWLDECFPDRPRAIRDATLDFGDALAHLDVFERPPGNQYAVVYPAGASFLGPLDEGGALVEAALRRLFIHNKTVGVERLAAAIRREVDELISMLAGEPGTGLFVHGFAGCRLEPGTSVKTPWGTVLNASTTSERRNFLRPASASVVLVTEMPCIVQAVDPDLGEWSDGPGQFAAEMEKIGRSLRLFSLACALAGDPGQPFAPTLLWGTTSVIGGGYGIASYGPAPAVDAVDLSQMQDGLAEWAERIDTEHHQRVDVAAERIGMALSGARLHHRDRLIDAVTAWENLLGSSSETTFRLTASTAVLLSEDPGERDQIRKAAKKAYDVRSRVVHGSLAGDDPKVRAAAKDATNLCLEVLRASYLRGHDWLGLQSDERGVRLLLGLDLPG